MGREQSWSNFRGASVAPPLNPTLIEVYDIVLHEQMVCNNPASSYLWLEAAMVVRSFFMAGTAPGTFYYSWKQEQSPHHARETRRHDGHYHVRNHLYTK